MWKFLVVPFLRLFLIVLERLVVAQGRRRRIVALALAKAGKMVLNSADGRMGLGGQRHGCRRIAAEAITCGSIASLAAPCKVRAIKVP